MFSRDVLALTLGEFDVVRLLPRVWVNFKVDLVIVILCVKV